MTALAVTDFTAVASLEELYTTLGPLHASAGWAKPEPSLWPAPRQLFQPALWPWETCKAALDAAGRLVSTELAERRNLVLYNPLEGNTYATTRTLIAAYQMILPGEKARAHRHTPNALRVILEGEGAYTVVDGVRLDMHPGDVVPTPNWCWHGHCSEADVPCYWLDGLDVPLVHLLQPMFFEPYPGGFQEPTMVAKNSPWRFSWDSTQAALDHASPDPEGYFGVRVQLGDPALSTMALYMQRLESGVQTRPLRTTANRCAVAGTGTTRVDGELLAWSRGDVIVVPAWRTHAHHAASDATLFCMTDEPVLRGLGWLRTA